MVSKVGLRETETIAAAMSRTITMKMTTVSGSLNIAFQNERSSDRGLHLFSKEMRSDQLLALHPYMQKRLSVTPCLHVRFLTSQVRGGRTPSETSQSLWLPDFLASR